MKRLTLGLDANGVVFDHVAKVHALMRVTGKEIPPYRFGSKQGVIEEFNLSESEYEKAMAGLFEKPTWFRKYSMLTPHCDGFVQGLTNVGFDIFVVSSCRGFAAGWVEDILREYKLPISGFISVDEANGESKLDFYAQCDVVIDDVARHLMPLLDDHPGTKPILMLPAKGGTGYEVIPIPFDLDRRISVGRGWEGVHEHIPKPEALAA